MTATNLLNHFTNQNAYFALPIIALLCAFIQLRLKGPLIYKNNQQQNCQCILAWFLFWVIGIHGLLLSITYLIPNLHQTTGYTNQAFSYINNIGRAITGKGLAIASIIAFMLNRRYFYLCVIIIFTINSIASCATDLIMFPIINNGDFREPETIYLITVFTKLIVPAISCILYYLAYKDKKTT